MKVTVTEAMRIKNEISHTINTLQMQSRYSLYGTIKEDGIEKQPNPTMVPFPDYLKTMEKAFSISEQLNSKLAELSVKTGISDMVRRKANLIVLRSALETAANQGVATSTTRHEVVGNTRTPIVTTFEPFMTKKDIKSRIKTIKAEIRTIQSVIDGTNAQQIELPFEYDDLEDFSIQEGE